MSCYIEQLSIETLNLIIQRLSDSIEDLRRCQLVNKRWQLISEKYIYSRLYLMFAPLSPHRHLPIRRKDPNLLALYGQFLLKPQRARLVKTLHLSEPLLSLDGGFFELFPNIEEVLFIQHRNQPINWKQACQTFTAERCGLKQLPYIGYVMDGLPYDKIVLPYCTMDYLYLIREHCSTLVELRLSVRPADRDEVMKFLLNECSFPSLTQACLLTYFNDLNSMDRVIDKFPHLVNLCMLYFPETNIPIDLSSITPHKKAKKVTISHAYMGMPNLLHYVTAKFPNTQHWNLVLPPQGHDISEKKYTVDPMEKIAAPLRLISRADISSIEFLTYASSTSEALDIFLTSDKFIKSVSISYRNPTKDSLRDHRKANGKRIDLAAIKGSNSPYYSTVSGCAVEIDYIFADLISHLSLLAKKGSLIRHLCLSLPFGNWFEHETKEAEEMLHGDALVHLFNHCPALVTLDYTAEVLNPMGALPFHKNLEKINLTAKKSIQVVLLMKLSHKATNLKEFTLSCPFEEESIEVETTSSTKIETKKQRRIVIDMKNSHFELLTLKEIRKGETHSKDSNEVILILIAVPGDPILRQYLTRYRQPIAQQRDSHRNRIQNYPKPESISWNSFPHVEITIRCASIKRLTYCSGCCGSMTVNF